MKTQILVSSPPSASPPSASPPPSRKTWNLLAGKWSLQKTNADGQRYTQQIEIKKDKFSLRSAMRTAIPKYTRKAT